MSPRTHGNDPKSRIEALEAASRYDGGAEAVREAARRYLLKEDNLERRAIWEALLVASDEEVCAYSAQREMLNERGGHPDASRDPGYFELMETLLARVSPSEAAGWRRLRDLYLAGLRSQSHRTFPPDSKHVAMFHVRHEPTDEETASLRHLWDRRNAAWTRRQEVLAGMIQSREQALLAGEQPVTDQQEAQAMIRAAFEEVEQEAGWSDSLDDLPADCPCWRCLKQRGRI